MNRRFTTPPFLLTFLLASSMLLISWQLALSGEAEAAADPEAAKTSSTDQLQGTWKLLAAKWNADTKQYADNVMYKIYTQHRFATIFFDPVTNAFSGGGGGTYTVTGNQVTEHIEYFSFDTTAVGSAQTFHFNIKDGIFHQSGTLNTQKYPNYQIHEFYERAEPGIGTLREKHPLAGVWNIEEASYGGKKSDLAARYGKVIKIITPTYFYGVFFNPETGYFNGITFGTWKTEGDQYTETIKAYSWDASAVGKTYSFNWKVEGNKFYQTGRINSDRYKDYEIREVSNRME
ncbi:MAG: hypothetical protein H6557_36275 [Lewinellaceae bacterium]|nr:hypothetical protein [Lewinellaceae bacterium]